MDILEELGSKPSVSEENGLSKLRDTDLLVFSPGISTAGFAEIRMVQDNPNRKVIATTVDQKGLDFARKVISKTGLTQRIETKLEDLNGKWTYRDDYFDFIYARLVLHYLTAQELDEVLKNFYKSLKPGGLMFVVVRSIKNINQNDPNIKIDPFTKIATISYYNKDGSINDIVKRYLHTRSSIVGHLSNSGFIINEVKEYKERLYKDFMRREISQSEDHIIELLCSKKV